LQAPLFGPLEIGRCVEIATAIEPDSIGTPHSYSFQPVNTSIHKGYHRPVWPPITITLGRFIAGQCQRITRFDQHNIAPTVNDG
jgi:hypothetical protein